MYQENLLKKAYPGKRLKHYDNPEWFSHYTPTKWNKPNGIRFTISPASYFDNRAHIAIGLGWIDFNINLPIYSTWEDCEYPEYGFYYHSNALVFQLGYEKRKFIHMPWDLTWVRTSRLKPDNSWLVERTGDVDKWKKVNPGKSASDRWQEEESARKNLWSEIHPYTYTLSSGEVQSREATIKVTEMEWRPRWFTWTKLFAKVRKSINVDFNGEVGERTGSWKGGVTGCSYEMLPREKPVDTLRRMESERKFD